MAEIGTNISMLGGAGAGAGNIWGVLGTLPDLPPAQLQAVGCFQCCLAAKLSFSKIQLHREAARRHSWGREARREPLSSAKFLQANHSQFKGRMLGRGEGGGGEK